MATLEAMLERKSKGLSQSEIAADLGVSLGSVAGKLWRYKQAMKSYKPVTNHAARDDTPKNVMAFPSLPKPQVIKRPENEDSDVAKWEAIRDRLLKNLTYVRVMRLNDLHLPFHDLAALGMWLEIAKRFQPHVVALGDDMNDYPTISSFEPDHDISVDDWQEQSREFTWPIIHQIDRLLPFATIVDFGGNHERRAIKAIKASDSPKIGMRYYIETRRCGGRVLYLGRTEHVEIGDLIIAHGNKAGKYAAANIGALWPDKVVNFGHIHKHQKIGNAFSNGMLCQMIPHYDDWGYPNNQEQGTSTMTVCTSGGVAWTHHNFVEVEGALIAQYGDGLISVAKHLDAESEAA